MEEELQDLRWEVERDSLVAERGTVGSDTTMAVVGVIGPSSDRGSSHRRRREMDRPHHDIMMFVVRGARSACGRGFSSRPTKGIEAVAESVFHASGSWC